MKEEGDAGHEFIHRRAPSVDVAWRGDRDPKWVGRPETTLDLA